MSGGSVWSEIRRLFRFIGVGGAATLVHLCVALGLSRWSGLSDQAANLAGFCAAFCFSFFGHHRVTFQSERRMGQTLPRFFLLAGSAYLLSAAVLAALQGVPIASELRVLLAALVIPVFTYVVSKYLIF